MDSTETKYNFYKRAFRGGAQTVQQTQEPALVSEPSPAQVKEQEQDPTLLTETSAPSPSATPSVLPTQADGLQQLNAEIPKTKIDFKIGNLDLSLGPKQKINIDKMLMEQLFGV